MSIVQYRKKETKPCVVCGASMTGYPSKQTCGVRCRSAKNRALQRVTDA